MIIHHRLGTHDTRLPSALNEGAFILELQIQISAGRYLIEDNSWQFSISSSINSGNVSMGVPGSSTVKNLACQCRRCRFHPWFGKISWGRKWQPTPVFLPGWQRSLVGCSTWGLKQSDMTYQLNNKNMSIWQYSNEKWECTSFKSILGYFIYIYIYKILVIFVIHMYTIYYV